MCGAHLEGTIVLLAGTFFLSEQLSSSLASSDFFLHCLFTSQQQTKLTVPSEVGPFAMEC